VHAELRAVAAQRAPSSSKRQVLDFDAAPPCELDTPVEPAGKGFPPVTDGHKHPSTTGLAWLMARQASKLARPVRPES
jgi:hypothetical protein